MRYQLRSKRNELHGSRRARFVWIPTVMLVFWLVASGVCPAASRTCVTDQLGRNICVSGEIKRVVSFAPNLTETLFALGVGDRLVGRSARCDSPAEALKVPITGGYMRPDLERVIAATPDLVVTTKRGAKEEHARRLQSIGIPVFVSECKNIDDIEVLVERLGRLFHREEQASRIIAEIRETREAVQNAGKGRSAPRVLFAVGMRPLVAAGGSSFIGALIREAGGVNIMEDISIPYPKINPEHVLRSDPEIIITLDKECASPDTCLKQWHTMPGVDAVRNGRIFFLEGDLMARPSPRITAALKRLGEVLHPEFKANTHDKRAVSTLGRPSDL